MKAAAQLLTAAAALLAAKRPAFLAIDGRCGSGKTTLAAALAAEMAGVPCQIIHMDDFYLPPSDRVENWLEIPAANMDLARLESELLRPLRAGQPGVYRPYSCRTASYGPAATLRPEGLVVIEGSYALHERLRPLYDLRVFVSCTPTVQRTRLQQREGDRWPAFAERWIPLEEGYFAAQDPAASCDLLLDTSEP